MPTLLLPEPFAGAKAKINRARKHQDELCGILEELDKNRPFEFELEEDPFPGRFHLVCRIKKVRDLPQSLPLVIGDVAHNLRSSLDHIAYRLVERGGKMPTDIKQIRQLAFPVVEQLVDFKAEHTRRLPGVTDGRVLKVIGHNQPFQPRYSRPEECPLFSLHRVDVIDKHRLLLIVGTALAGDASIAVTVPPAFSGVKSPKREDIRIYWNRPKGDWLQLSDGEIAFRIEAPVPVNVLSRLEATISFGLDQGTPTGIADTIDAWFGLVEGVVTDLQCLL